jgi:hypothetical protein
MNEAAGSLQSWAPQQLTVCPRPARGARSVMGVLGSEGVGLPGGFRATAHGGRGMRGY